MAYGCNDKLHGLDIMEEARRIAELDTPTADGATVLQQACWDGDTQRVNELLEEGVDVNLASPASRMCTPLHICARAGHSHLVETLVSAGADIYAKNTDGDLPLHVACRRGNLVSVKALLAADNKFKSLVKKNVKGRRPRDLVPPSAPSYLLDVLEEYKAKRAAARPAKTYLSR